MADKRGRNLAAHPAPQDIEAEFTRAHLFHIADVLGKINAPEQKRAVEDIRERLFSASDQTDAAPAEPKLEPDSGGGKEQSQRQPRSSSDLDALAQRDRANHDVAQGDFQQSEFAADLQQVYDGRADATQYGNPVSFFNHTYITPGIRTLLSIPSSVWQTMAASRSFRPRPDSARARPTAS